MVSHLKHRASSTSPYPPHPKRPTESHCRPEVPSLCLPLCSFTWWKPSNPTLSCSYDSHQHHWSSLSFVLKSFFYGEDSISTCVIGSQHRFDPPKTQYGPKLVLSTEPGVSFNTAGCGTRTKWGNVGVSYVLSTILYPVHFFHSTSQYL